MKVRYVLSTAALLLVMGGTQAAFAWEGQYGKGDPKHPIGNSTWPVGVADLANRADRIGGFWINSADTFFYAGDAKAFNNFLRQYAKGEGSHSLLLRANDAFAMQPLHGDHADWDLQAGFGAASVGLSLNGRITLRDLHIPQNVHVDFLGTRTKEVDAFLARHRSQNHSG